MSDAVIRPARREESAEIAKLFLISSDGLAAYIWSQIERPGLSLIEIGAERYTREVDRRALVPHPTLHYDEGDAVLLVCDLA